MNVKSQIPERIRCAGGVGGENAAQASASDTITQPHSTQRSAPPLHVRSLPSVARVYVSIKLRTEYTAAQRQRKSDRDHFDAASTICDSYLPASDHPGTYFLSKECIIDYNDKSDYLLIDSMRSGTGWCDASPFSPASASCSYKHS